MSSPVYHSQICTLLVAAFPPVVTNLLYLFKLTLIEYLDPTPFGFAVASFVMYWALFRQGFLDLSLEVASTLIYNMADGVIVVDSVKRVVDINPAMKKILRVHGKNLIGSDVRQVFSEWPGAAKYLFERTELQAELSLKRENERLHFDLRISPLPKQQGGG